MGCGSSNLAPAVAAQALESASRALQPEELSEAEAGINESFELDDNTFDIIEDPSLELRAEGEEGQLCRAAPVTDYTSLNPVDLVSATQNLGTEWRLKRANKGISKGSLKDDGNQVLRVKFFKGSLTPSGTKVPGGFSFDSAPRGNLPAKSATFRYRIFIDPKMDFNKGGKMGFGFGINGTGAGGGNRKNDTASIRITFSSTGPQLYVYPGTSTQLLQSSEYSKAGIVGFSRGGYRKDKDKWYGDSWFAGQLQYTKGAWHDMEVGVKMNTFKDGKPMANGVGWLAMNGTKFSYDKMVWCTNPNGKIDYLEGSMFFGGSTQDWANPHDTYVLIEKCQLVTVV